MNVLLIATSLMLTGAIAIALLLRLRHLDRWLGSYLLMGWRRRGRVRTKEIHLLLCIADHYEPGNGGASEHQADERVHSWLRNYPAVLGGFRDCDGRPPQHTFFYPIEQYNAAHVAALAALCHQGFGEVEVHR